MTCRDAGTQIDAFVDGELSPSASVEVARHVGQCPRCDGAVRRLLTVRDVLLAESERAVSGLDLSRVWAHVGAEATRIDAQAAWRARSSRRLSRGMAWGSSIAAIAAGAALFLRMPGGPTAVPVVAKGPTPVAATKVADKRLPNHVYIDRLAGKDIALRREPKSGTTMIWVNHEVPGSGW